MSERAGIGYSDLSDAEIFLREMLGIGGTLTVVDGLFRIEIGEQMFQGEGLNQVIHRAVKFMFDLGVELGV
jgi:hypothetical protein